MKNHELMQEIQKLEKSLPSGLDYTKIDDCEFLQNWKCPIGLDLMIEPVLASDGFTYEKANFDAHIAQCQATLKSLTSPLTGADLPAGATCFPVNSISSEINDFLEKKLTELKKLVESIQENEKKLHALVQKGLAHREKKEYIQAIACFKEAAEQEHAGGWYGLARMYKYGLGVDKNPEEAEVLFNKVRGSAEKGNAFAQYYWGQICEWEIISDLKKIPEYYRQAAEDGIVEAMYALGHLHCSMFAKDYGLRYRDREEIVKWFTLATNAGHAEAQYELARIYEMGDDGKYGYGPNIPKNDELARHYFNLAAAQGHSNAKQDLERMCKKVDPQLPTLLLRAALKSSVAPISSSTCSASLASSTNPQPSAPPLSLLEPMPPISSSSSSSPSNSNPAPSVASQSSFFNANAHASSIKKDPAILYNEGCKHRDTGNFHLAKQCFEEAAKQKSTEACYELALLYENRHIDASNERQPLYAQYWYMRAYEYGHSDAAYRLGRLHEEYSYCTGSVSIDGNEIYLKSGNTNSHLIWYKRAGPNHAEAQYKLGHHYNKTLNMLEKAYSHYQRAANQGHEMAYAALEQLIVDLRTELDSYVTQKKKANASSKFTSSNDIIRVELATILIDKLSGKRSDRKFSQEELKLISTSDGLNRIFSKQHFQWVTKKLNGEWAQESQPQNTPPTRMGISSGR